MILQIRLKEYQASTISDYINDALPFFQVKESFTISHEIGQNFLIQSLETFAAVSDRKYVSKIADNVKSFKTDDTLVNEKLKKLREESDKLKKKLAEQQAEMKSQKSRIQKNLEQIQEFTNENLNEIPKIANAYNDKVDSWINQNDQPITWLQKYLSDENAAIYSMFVSQGAAQKGQNIKEMILKSLEATMKVVEENRLPHYNQAVFSTMKGKIFQETKIFVAELTSKLLNESEIKELTVDEQTARINEFFTEIKSKMKDIIKKYQEMEVTAKQYNNELEKVKEKAAHMQ